MSRLHSSDRQTPILSRIVSGGQTGVDRAALDVARELGIPSGGWCPRGRLAEDGPIDDIYPLGETPSSGYAERTEWNVRDSDGTLILTSGTLSGGTALTKAVADRLGKPCFIVDLGFDGPFSHNSRMSPAESAGTPETGGQSAIDRVVDWLENHTITVLNVAGPRESLRPGIHGQAVAFLRKLIRRKATSGSRGRNPVQPPARG